MIQLSRLEGFFWVARTGGYAKAVRAFPYPITEPGVHQQVRKLEADLGERLFVRTGHSEVQLTPVGRALYSFVAPFLEQLPQVVRSLRAHTFGGTLRIHAAGQVLRHILPAWLRRLQEARPDVDVDVREIATGSVELLRTGESDLVVDHIAELPEQIEAQQIGTMWSFIVTPKVWRERSASERRRGLRALPELLGGKSFVAYPPDRPQFDLQRRALQQLGLKPGRNLVASSAETILGLVEAGLGFSLVPWLDRKGPRSPDVIAQRLDLPGASFPIVAAFRAGPFRDPVVMSALACAPSVGRVHGQNGL